jgi:hypothetical protein
LYDNLATAHEEWRLARTFLMRATSLTDGDGKPVGNALRNSAMERGEIWQIWTNLCVGSLPLWEMNRDTGLP